MHFSPPPLKFMSKVMIKFWGVRGSMAAPGLSTARYGGNTSCVEINCNGESIICDAGTGIRGLGTELIRLSRGRPIGAHILLSHLHWDHYIGLPFFRPLYFAKNLFTIAGPLADGDNFGAALSRAMKPPYFPIPVSDIPSVVTLRTIAEKAFLIGRVRIKPKMIKHPGGAFGWRFTFPNGRSLVHITDAEPDSQEKIEKLVRWMRGADILIHDAQFGPESYKKHIGWGHSPWTYPIELAGRAGIKKVALFHFDPGDSDKYLDDVSKEAKSFALSVRRGLECCLAHEGLVFNL